VVDRWNLDVLVGSWEGENRLWMDPNAAGEASPASARMELVAGGGFASLAYTWALDGKGQDGVLLVRRADQLGPLDAVWVDSFHTGGGFMTFQGEVDPAGRWSLYGTYGADAGPAWGWRIAIDRDEGEDTFRLAMWNVPPGGADERAVEARFWRAAGG
jgi:hypothetical protein